MLSPPKRDEATGAGTIVIALGSSFVISAHVVKEGPSILRLRGVGLCVEVPASSSSVCSTYLALLWKLYLPLHCGGSVHNR